MIRWKLPLQNRGTLSEEKYSSIYDDLRCWGLFVKGAPAFLAENICTAKGLANGTSVRLHSLGFPTSEDDNDAANLTFQIRQQIANASGGSVVTLQVPPLTINITIVNASAADWPDDQTLVEGDVVIPVFRAKK